MDQIKIGKYIAEKRKTLGLTQVELADRLGMSNKSVSKWERGVCLPDVSVYMELCDILGISLNEFLQGEDLEPEVVEKRSEENIISVTKEGNRRSRRSRKAAVILGVLAAVIALGTLMFLIKEGYLARNYLKSYDINSSMNRTVQAVVPFGHVQMYDFSCGKTYKEIEVSIYKKDDGRMRNKLIGSAEFPIAYEDGTGKKAAGKGTLAVACYDYKLTVSCLGSFGMDAYQLDLRDVIDGVEDKGALYHYAFGGDKKLTPGHKMVLYALDYGYDGANFEPYAYEYGYSAPGKITYEDLDDMTDDPEGILEGYNDIVFVTVIFN